MFNKWVSLLILLLPCQLMGVKHFMILWIRQTIRFNLIKQVFSALRQEMLPPLLHAPLALLFLLVLLWLDVPFLCS